MTPDQSPYYAPALRMKAGELQGLRSLSSDIADLTLPRMIVPPTEDETNPAQLSLFDGETVPDIARPLASHWPGRDVLVEPTHLIREFGVEGLASWLPKMFSWARKASVHSIPLFQIRDLLSIEVSTVEQTIDRSALLQFGLIVSSGDLVDHDALLRSVDLIEHMGVTPEQCVVVADFHDADLSDPDVVAPIIGGALDYLRSVAPWRHVIFQGTNFPEKNPAAPDSCALVPRNEWIAWKTAVAFDPSTADHLLFGDYAADSSKLSFGKGGAKAYRHYRYTTPESWYIQRGPTSGKDKYIMADVCRKVIESGYFSGRDFSSADEYIYMTAKDKAGPGHSTIWRAVNTTHHITRVITDMGVVKGRIFKRRTAIPLEEQMALL